MTRAFLIVMDSVGCGGAPDAADFGDAGANTLAHVAQAVGGLRMPVLDALGLGAAVRLASGAVAVGLASALWPAAETSPPSPLRNGEGRHPTGPMAPPLSLGRGDGGEAAGTAGPRGRWGAATEVSRGKDTPSGHWELAGVPVPWDWTYFPKVVPCFPEALVAEVCARAGTTGILGNTHASGVPIIEALGAEHLRTGWPICYTSADSVFQIAAHEEAFGLPRLLTLCEALAPSLHAMRVGRVIARPFVGTPGSFRRTGNRRDYAMTPPAPTILDRALAAGRMTHAVGKIGDIFAHMGIGKLWKGQSDFDLSEHLLTLSGTEEPGSLTFANFVEFDSLYGHRRDPAGYARALEWFDGIAGTFLARLRPGDLAIFTADHGNDPTWPGTDHTRERVPVLIHGAGAGALGLCAMADVAETIARHLGLPETGPGKALL